MKRSDDMRTKHTQENNGYIERLEMGCVVPLPIIGEYLNKQLRCSNIYDEFSNGCKNQTSHFGRIDASLAAKQLLEDIHVVVSATDIHGDHTWRTAAAGGIFSVHLSGCSW